eukprot:NODE_187_length_15673_cov_0.222743.p11 type:complete len:107 gc:universal NODE_187_length_15673_cov_0.222743:5319-5639(+)
MQRYYAKLKELEVCQSCYSQEGIRCFPIRSRDDGQWKERSSISRRQREMDCTQPITLDTCWDNAASKRKRIHLYTAELAPNTKRKISSTRYFECKSGVQVLKASRM